MSTTIYGNVYADGHSNNSMFAIENTVHKHNPTDITRQLRDAFLAHGIEINTPDVNAGRDIAFELHLEGRPLTQNKLPKYFVALENPNINRLNESPEYCQQFRLVFAWDKRLYNLPNVVPIHYPHPMTFEAFPGLAQRDIFSCLINANKAFKEVLPSDLYLERIQTIRWYEKHALNLFSLYGLGWEKSTPAFDLAGKLKRSVSRLKTRLFGIPPFPSYRGEVADKADVLRRARFSYTYENSKGLDNYVTEKIFDSLVNGCVPVYWGADNILDLISGNCFIDRRSFADTAAVHRFLLSITAEDYAAYQRNIVNFLSSANAEKFSARRFAKVISERVSQDMGVSP